MTSPARTNRNADATGHHLVSARDLELLPLIAEQCVVTQRQLARLIDRSERTARWLRDRWRRAGWAEARVLLVSQPAFIWLTPRGQQACGVDFKPWRPQAIGRLPHLAAVTDVRLHLAARRPEATWVSERVVARELARQDKRRTHLPDAELLIGENRVAIEVELTQKERRRTEAIMDELCLRYDAVCYFAAAGARRQLEALAARPSYKRVQVLAVEDCGSES
jgi:hypothetical protein